MAITKPALPPKEGYVEVEIGGERLYKNAKTGVLLREEKPTPSAWDEMATAVAEGVNMV